MKGLVGPIVALGVLVGAAAWGKSQGSVRVDVLSSASRRVFVDNRSYMVFRYASGTYSVILEKNPTVNVTFNQTAEVLRTGNAEALAQLDSDMKRFPSNLFQLPEE